MPRKARDIFDASFFHVIVQGINKEFIFKEERFINQYLKLIRKHIDDYNVEIIAYCIMGNHAHFLLKTDSIEEISKVMHKTNGMYAKYYNYINERVGSWTEKELAPLEEKLRADITGENDVAYSGKDDEV